MLCLTENLEFFLKNTLIYTIKMSSLKHIYSTIFNHKATQLKKNFCINVFTETFFNIGNYISVVLIKLQL